MVAPDRALEPLADRDACHIDHLADLEHVRLQFAADLEVGKHFG